MLRKLSICGFLGVFLLVYLFSVSTIPDAFAEPEKVKVIIAFNRQPGPPEQALMRGAGGEIKYTYHIVPAIAATLPEAAINALLRNPAIARIEPDIKVYAVDAELDDSWGVKRIGAGTVHDSENKGTGIKVAIIDTGIDYNHPDLIDNYKGGDDFVNGDTDPMDDAGHGTHVAGTVAAKDDGVGVVGVAPEAYLYALKVLGSDGSGDYSDVIAALQWCVDNGIEVTNNSYGSSGDPGETVKAAFDESAAAGILHVSSAGNTGNPPGRGDNVGFPARYESVIAVAATDNNDKRARFSSTGPDVELAAPGVYINSTLLGGGYGIKSGTSMASPHVAGTAALVIAAEIDDVRTQLQITADDLGSLGLDPLYGYGLVDADEAAGTLPPPPNELPVVSLTSPVDGSTFESGASILFEGTAIDAEDGDLTTNLVWTSNIDGQIGTGGSYTATLSDGNHTITSDVTDSGGQTGNDSISITVGSPPSTGTMYVKSIAFSSKVAGPNKFLYITVTVVDGSDDPLEGVRVVMTLESGSSWNFAGDTGADGTVKFTPGKVPSGEYTAEVTSLNLTGYMWDDTEGVTSASCTLKDDGSVTPQGAAKPVVSTLPANSLGNYPNPANPETTIRYSINQPGHVSLSIYNMLGQHVRTLADEVKAHGVYHVLWDGKDENGNIVSSGIYIYQLRSEQFVESKTLSLIR